MMEYKELDNIKYIPVGENQNMTEKQKNWAIAFGLQEVDNLKPSKYMVELARENM